MRTRTREIAKWTSATGSLILLAIWILASSWYVEYYDWTGKTKYCAVFERNGIAVLASTDNSITRARNGTGWRVHKTDRPETHWPKVRFNSPLKGVSVWIPLWCMILPLLLVSILTWRGKQKTQPCCPKCEYDLTGNISGVCPECGTSVECERTQ